MDDDKVDKGKKIPPRLMIAAPSGRSGKTIISLGICASLKKRGLSVQPFKKGPDYIDPSWLSAACQRNCRNLDTFLMKEEVMLKNFQKASVDADMVIIEGNMGLFDGIDEVGTGSSAEVARRIGAPIILIIDTTRMSRSIAALVSGFQHFEPNTTISGVILNKVAGARHEAKLVHAIEKYCQIPVLGVVPKNPRLNIAERHLGLIPSIESHEPNSILEGVSKMIEPHLNLDALIKIGRNAKESFFECQDRMREGNTHTRIGVLFDRVFNFYYPENLEALRQVGADLVFIDSLSDTALPDIKGLYIGGGFPEFFLGKLEANKPLRKAIKTAIEDGLPVYAECAGLMYLGKGIRSKGKYGEMVGIFPIEIEMDQKPQGHGYVEVEVARENPFFPVGLTIHGHEFHHSKFLALHGLKGIYRVHRGRGIDGMADGLVYKNVFAAYTHLHALGVPQWPEAFMSLISKQQRSQSPFRAPQKLKEVTHDR